MKQRIFLILFVLGVLGIIDAGYLTYEHFAHTIPTCTVNRLLPFFSDCGQVLRSQYSVVFGIPLALLGLIHYVLLTLIIGFTFTTHNRKFILWILIQAGIGTLFSLYLMYLQIFIIKSLCLYCTISALLSFILFFLLYFSFSDERKRIFISSFSFKYQYILKPLLFLINPEIVHEYMLKFGELLGTHSWMRKIFSHFFQFKNLQLGQKIAGIEFQNPIGLAAGFDYNAQLTQILSSIGFGFQTGGTITNLPYAGNPKPMLGRLPKSRSLMVNKGFKNKGADSIIDALNNSHFDIPVGISIGRTNSPLLKNQKESVEDILSAFKKFENSLVKNSYYELNISCPNIIHGRDISFYPSRNLRELLQSLKNLIIKKPVFVKMPIEKTNEEIREMLQIMSEFSFVKGMIFGNLQKDRTNPSLDKEEVKLWKVGNFSGKPCEQRSNELIRFAYQNFAKRFVIIGCGGVFSAKDAYKKIKLGASLVQLITGMIYQGPALITQINLELIDLLKEDGFKNIKDAVGREN